MTAIVRADDGLPGLMPLAPRFDFHELPAIEALAQWEVLAAALQYDVEVRPFAHDWALERGAELWARHRPWWLNL